MALRVLIIQSDLKTAQPLIRFFTTRGDQVWQADQLDQGWGQVGEVKPQLILMDLHFSSNEWINLLRRIRQAYPDIPVIMTNKFPDLQREMMARENGVKVFLREPFSNRWINQAVQKVQEKEDTQPARHQQAGQQAAEMREAKVEAKPAPAGPKIRPVRVPVRIKITLPYLILALLFALASGYVVSKVVLESIQDRFLNQLIETGKQGTDWMVREESRLLETERLVANTQGVSDAIQHQDAEGLRNLVLPVALNANEEAIEILDLKGVSVLSLHHSAGDSTQDFKTSRGDNTFQRWDFVQKVLQRKIDANGDKFAGSVQAPWGNYFYISGPVLDQSGQLAGVVLVGKSLQTLVRQMHVDTLGEITIYDLKGTPLATTAFIDQSFPIAPDLVVQSLAGQDRQTLTRELDVTSRKYTEILAPWEARYGVDQGVLGVSLMQSFLLRTSQVTLIEIFVLVAAGVLFVLIVGMSLANLITRPLLRLVKASSQVAQGNLEVKVDATGDDEVAVLAQSFNYMVAGLQEGSIYRDLLGRTVSPEVREQLRQTFTSGKLRLEGQQAVATVLMSDIRGFTPISEKADPATVFQWLNEYFAHMVPWVASHGGVVNKFDGDAMLAFFGILPRILSPRQSAVAACQAALEILEAVNQLNTRRIERGEPPMVTGIGVNTGVMIAGGLGTSDRLHYTIIGDTVNTTQRIEALTRDVMNESGILISQSTFSALGEDRAQFNIIPLGERNVKGKEEPIFVYRLLPWGDQSNHSPSISPSKENTQPVRVSPARTVNAQNVSDRQTPGGKFIDRAGGA